MARKSALDPYERRLRETDRKLREALDRLVKREPTHPDLKKRPYRLTVSTLAREAGIGRNAIYNNHRTMLGKLEKARQKRVVPGQLASWQDKVTELRTINEELLTENRRIVTENAALLKRSRKAEAESKRLERNNARLIRQRDEALKPVPLAPRRSP